ncbi:MAG TPA: hypothetical protein VF847_07780 [Candidatus Deferrimicrobiaceae bacterium]
MRSVLHGAFLLALAIVPAARAGETVLRDLGNTKIIRSNEAPHNILGEACLACHPKETFDFWLLIYKGKPPTLSIDPPEGKREVPPSVKAATAAGKANRYNAHDALQCNICHFENPTAASPRFIVEVKELCRLCHPGVSMHRVPAGEDLARVKKAIREKVLPGQDGEPLCTTCHKVHDSTYSMRQAYAQVLWEGKVPNPHGSRLLCFACHPGRIREGEEVRYTSGRDIVRLCNECHAKPGVRKAPHVVDVASSDGTWRMDYLGYPLSQGKLTCSTCHDEVSHGKPDSANPKFLRGGPYADQDSSASGATWKTGRCTTTRTGKLTPSAGSARNRAASATGRTPTLPGTVRRTSIWWGTTRRSARTATRSARIRDGTTIFRFRGRN